MYVESRYIISSRNDFAFKMVGNCSEAWHSTAQALNRVTFFGTFSSNPFVCRRVSWAPLLAADMPSPVCA